MAAAAAVITAAASQPNHLSSRGFTRSPITARSEVSSTTSTISGGASTPLATADQKSIFTASRPTRSSATPSTMATASTQPTQAAPATTLEGSGASLLRRQAAVPNDRPPARQGPHAPASTGTPSI